MAQDSTQIDIKTFLKEPELYRVLLINDDYTAMDFVVRVLMEVFEKTSDEATNIMLKIHNEGQGVCGVYTYDVAELKTHIVHEMARELGYPLRATTEKIN